MEFHIKVNGFKEKDKVKVFKYGLMEVNMSDNGKTIKLTVKVLCIMQTVIFMKVNGLMIKHVDKELIHIKMEPNMLDNGKMINKMAMV